jgi:hypothetical protein
MLGFRRRAQSALRADSKRGLSGSFSTAPIRANCLTLNQKKCKFLYDGHTGSMASLSACTEEDMRPAVPIHGSDS